MNHQSNLIKVDATSSQPRKNLHLAFHPIKLNLILKFIMIFGKKNSFLLSMETLVLFVKKPYWLKFVHTFYESFSHTCSSAYGEISYMALMKSYRHHTLLRKPNVTLTNIYFFPIVTNFRLNLGENERDIVILRHEFVVHWPDNTREEKGVNFVVYGKPGGHSAMALTVGYPAAIATKMLLDGEIQERGVILPFAPDAFIPILSRLRAEGFTSSYSSRIIS